MKVKIQTLNQLQVETDRWLAEVLGAERAKDVRERNYRFGEEAIELMHAAGMSFPELVKLAIYVFNKPQWTSNPAEEAGDTLHVLVGLITALGEDLDKVVAKSLEKLASRTEATKIKAGKWTGGPLPGDVDKQYANNVGQSVVGDFTEQLLRANRDALQWQEAANEWKKELEDTRARHKTEIERIEARYKVHLGDIKNLEMRLDNALELNAAQKCRIENLESVLGQHEDVLQAAMDAMDREVPVVSTEHGNVGVIKGDPAEFIRHDFDDRHAAYAQVMPDDAAAHATLEIDGLKRRNEILSNQVGQLQGSVERLRKQLVDKATRANNLKKALNEI